jgi:hypothetical protein
MKKSIVPIFFAVFMSSYGGILNATPLQWFLDGVTFDDGTTVSGDYFYNADTGAYSDWNITTQATDLYTGYNYSTESSLVWYQYSKGFELWDGEWLDEDGDGIDDIVVNWTHNFSIRVLDEMTNAGGTIAIDPYTWNCEPLVINCGAGTEIDLTYPHPTVSNLENARWIIAGSVTTETPEPTTLALLGLGLFGLGFAKRRVYKIGK